MTDPNGDAGDDDWKSRYQKALADCEARETELAQRSEALKRAVHRLGAVAEGADPTLDRRLQELARSVRDDASVERIDEQVAALSNALLRSDDAASPGQDTRPRAMLELVERLTPERELRRRARELLKTDDRGGYRKDPEALWRDTLALIESALEGSAGRGSLMDRLLKRGEASGAGAGDDEAAIPRQVRDALLNMLERIPLPQALEPSAERLRRRLKHSLSVSDLPDAVESVADLLVDSSHEESQALESFLKQLTDRLADIQGFLQQQQGGVQDSGRDNEVLNEAIRSQVDGLRSTISAAEDLDSLKGAVRHQLDAIVQRLDTYLRAQSERQREADAQIEALRGKLAETEAQTDQLRESLMQNQQRAQLDALTQLANRESYEQRFDYELARHRRYGTSLSVVVVDLDHFKAINDRFGHSAGDKVLRTVSRVLSQNLRETDFLARYGGEEFVVLMPETPLAQAVKAAEKVRRALADSPFHAGDKRLPVTLSAGVTEVREGDDKTSAFDRADAALYAAKDAGRNRVSSDGEAAGAEAPRPE